MDRLIFFNKATLSIGPGHIFFAGKCTKPKRDKILLFHILMGHFDELWMRSDVLRRHWRIYFQIPLKEQFENHTFLKE